MNESEWKKFKRLKELCLERFCSDVLEEAESISGVTDQSAHDRYRSLYRLIHDKDKELARAFDGHSRSKAEMQLI
jgi:hypothetical protein